MPASAAMSAPPVVVFSMLPDEIEEIAKLVVVACDVVALPPVKFCSVDDAPARKPPVRVESPVTPRVEESVALWRVARPLAVRVPKVAPLVALNCPPIVLEAEAKNDVEVPLPKEKLPPVMRPVFDTEKRVVDTPLLEVEAMAKSEVRTEVEAACTPSVANCWVDEPTVSEPRSVVLPVVVAPPETVRPLACPPLPTVVEASSMSGVVVAPLGNG